jgi:hypothetical protein
MNGKQPFRPWGELSWVLSLSTPKRWHFIGCLGTEERSLEALLQLYATDILSGFDMLRIHDTSPTDGQQEHAEIAKRLARCSEAGISLNAEDFDLNAPLNNAYWQTRLRGTSAKNICVDVSCLPKRFFFPLIKAAITSSAIENFLILYSKPGAYPSKELSSNPDPWKTIDGFMCDDPDVEKTAATHLIINPGFAVEGLRSYLADCDHRIKLDILIPFPAEPWRSVRRAWESARDIEECLQIDREGRHHAPMPDYHRVSALDTSTAFESLLRLTSRGNSPAALAPLGPKPISVAMCLLAAQTDRHPVYYAQPKSYANDYSTGFEKTFSYWVKHEGDNLYEL